MKVAIYIRVSREGEETILENQRRNALEYAARCGWGAPKVYEDVASGGSDDRPGLNALRDDIRARRVDLVIFTSLSRMTRGGVGAALYILHELEQNGCGWHFTEQGLLNFDANTQPLAKDILLSVLASIDKEYRRVISEKTKAALARKKALGQKLGRHPKGCMCKKHGEKERSA
jgi:DNA invertase Pin-like site-specific DNA recombinase